MSAAGMDRERIVVGVDGSEASRAALAWALDEARRRAARLDAVSAWRPTATIAPPAGHPSASTRSIAERRADAEELLDAELRALPADGVEVERRAMRGTPHRVLLEAAREATMVVVGGRSGLLAGKMPWSTGRQVVQDAACPVVVVPPQARPQERRPGAVRSRSAQPPRARAGLAGGGQLPG
jgi:nucleotide-binding universal stress UspA family protein